MKALPADIRMDGNREDEILFFAVDALTFKRDIRGKATNRYKYVNVSFQMSSTSRVFTWDAIKSASETEGTEKKLPIHETMGRSS